MGEVSESEFRRRLADLRDRLKEEALPRKDLPPVPPHWQEAAEERGQDRDRDPPGGRP